MRPRRLALGIALTFGGGGMALAADLPVPERFDYMRAGRHARARGRLQSH